MTKPFKSPPFKMPPFGSELNLIETALKKSKEARLEFLSLNMGITEPLSPRAVHSHQYLLVREFMMRGCREATKLVLDHYRRPAVYGILVSACEDIFHFGMKPEIITYHNNLLDRIIGTH